MSKGKWICNLCGSDEVFQEYSILADMNGIDHFSFSFNDADALDFFMCMNCNDDRVDPIWKTEEELKKEEKECTE
jgi:hypothetical protein